MSEREFAELLGVGQILPGANVTNFSAMLGYRYCGWRGAGAAILGLLTPAFIVTLGLGFLYRHYGALTVVSGALRGITSVAVGLIFLTGLKLVRSETQNRRKLAFGLGSFLSVGVLSFSLLATLGVLIPLSLWAEWRADP